MAVGSSGWLADGLVARGWSVTTVRKRIQTVAFLGPAAALTVLSNPATPPSLAVACLTAALGITSLGALETLGFFLRAVAESPKSQSRQV